jgi:CYTH domain-containing protein
MEIERKYLVDPVLFNEENQITLVEHILQAYLCSSPSGVVRLRHVSWDDEMSELIATIKYPTINPVVRIEYEFALVPISVPTTRDPRELLRLLSNNAQVIDKTRYHVQYGDVVITVDKFNSIAPGLHLAEIEFDTLDDAKAMTKLPKWVLKEVTDIPGFTNNNLASSTTSEIVELIKKTLTP